MEVTKACGRMEVPEACGMMEVPEACAKVEVPKTAHIYKCLSIKARLRLKAKLFINNQYTFNHSSGSRDSKKAERHVTAGEAGIGDVR
ncbi:hypothetical protein GBA52_016553 [Prunus armeniaca]|nr:hypothetical protein GBA52_016553 [Prunus armeniaca]